MSLPADTPPAVADALGYLQHHLQELTERQNALEHTINATLAGLTAQLQQLTQLITAPRPDSRSASDTPISASCQLSFPGPSRPIQTADEAKTPFSSRLLRQTEFRTSLSQLLHAVFTPGPGSSSPAMRKKSSGPSPSSRMDVLQSGPKTSFARRRTPAFFQFDPGPTSNNNSGVNSFWSMQKRTPSTLWRGLHTIKETGQWTITWTAS